MSDEASSEIFFIRRPEEMTLMDQFDQWLKELVYPGDVVDFVEENKGYGNDEEEYREVTLYTDEHQYRIVAHEKKEGESYLGCGVLARKARAGESWQRGNDLPDGPFNKETWNRIIYSIVNYELVKLTPFRRPDTIPDDVG